MNPDRVRDEHQSRAISSFLLVPMMPTPNGPLHLGHIAGPYLKMDVLARALRQDGHPAAVISTTDAFESHVLQAADKLGLSVETTCDHFHEAIRRDFAYMQIAFDAFVNPLSAPWADAFRSTHARVTDALVASGRVRCVAERYLHNEQTDEPVLGFRLSGRCPSCNSDTVGFVCENCGLQSTSEMLVEPRDVRNGDALVWRTGKTLALDMRDRDSIELKISATHLPHDFKRAMTEFLMGEDNFVRLTMLDGFGVGTHAVKGEQFTLYNSYFGHAIFCGEVYSRIFGTCGNPFASESSVTTITSCGLDNATDLTSCMACAAAHGEYKSFDYYLGNFFLTLGGRKFSTSLGSAVFVSDLVNRPEIDVDAMRFYLATISPHDGMRNFEMAEFMAFQKEWFLGDLGAVLGRASNAGTGNRVDAPSQALKSEINAAMRERDRALSFESCSLPMYASAIRRYCSRAKQFLSEPNEAAWWAEGFARIAAPLMPALCARIVQDLGERGYVHSERAPAPSWEAGTAPEARRAARADLR